MLNFISNEVLAISTQLGVVAQMLSPDIGDAFRTACTKKYARGETTWLWEHRAECVASHDIDVSALLTDNLHSSNVLLFFNRDDDPGFFLFRDGGDLGRVLAECFRFEYYVTNEAAEYLICKNHHGIVYVSGIAEDWVQSGGSGG